LTRIDRNLFDKKNVAILCATPSDLGGAAVRRVLTVSLPYYGAEVIGSLGLDTFHETAIQNSDGSITVEDEMFTTEMIKIISNI